MGPKYDRIMDKKLCIPSYKNSYQPEFYKNTWPGMTPEAGEKGPGAAPLHTLLYTLSAKAIPNTTERDRYIQIYLLEPSATVINYLKTQPYGYTATRKPTQYLGAVC